MNMTISSSSVLIAKNVSYIGAFFVGLNFESFGILAVLMILDVITGVIKSGILYGGKSVTSHTLSAGLLSKLLVILVPLIIALAGKGAGINLIPLAQGALTVFIFSEAYSILGNIYSIRTREQVKEFDAISLVIISLRGFLEKALKAKIPEERAEIIKK